METVILRFDLKGQVKKGQKGSIFKIQNLENKTHFSDSVSSQESNGVICFLCTMSYKWPKNMINFYDVTTFHTYYSHLGVKNWDRNFKFGMLATLMCVLYI